ncbi:MAG TPA: beta-glucosidase [Rhizomicrobium sp.]|jgi:beta-glucosidase
MTSRQRRQLAKDKGDSDILRKSTLIPAAAVLVMLGSSVFAAGAPLQLAPPTTNPNPWMNRALSPDRRADLLQSQMTEDEELRLVMGYWGTRGSPFSRPIPKDILPLLRGTAGYVPGIPRLGIPPLVESDAGLGVANGGNLRPGDEATALPSGMLMAATWDPELAFSAGSMVGAEARARGFNVVLDGGVNLAREPRGGRTFEYAGEDPLLAGTMAGAEIEGIQSNGIVSTVKHFAFNDQETDRAWLSANIAEGPARESDLLAFEIALEKGDPGAVMCAYNRHFGTYSCENDFLLNKVLKQEWNYHGWVLSDWGGVHSTLESANAGLDQESASGFDREDYFGAPLASALSDGKFDPHRLSDMVHRILRSMFAKGLMDTTATPSNIQADLGVAQNEAENGIVLLKNAGNLLPLATPAESIVVIGSHADFGVMSGGGSSQVIPIGYAQALQSPDERTRSLPHDNRIYDPPSPVSAIAVQAPQAIVTFESGDDIPEAANAARQANIAIVFASQWMAEENDVPNLNLPGNQNALIQAVAAANPRTVVVLETGGPVLMPWLDKVPAVVEAWYSGNRGATAIARVLFGAANPSGRLPVTFPQSESQLPHPVLPGLGTRGNPITIDYFEGADVGYRWFALKNETPLFPFGFGLSYSQFQTNGVAASGGATITVTADITNNGPMEGKETVEAYASPAAPDTDEMPRLIGWSKIDLMPGETKHVSIAADPRRLADFDVFRHRWHIDEGDYVVRVADSSISLGSSVTVKLDQRDILP